MLLFLHVTGLLFFQSPAGGTPLSDRIPRLLQTVLTASDEKQEEAAGAEAKSIFLKRGIPGIAEAGDDASYDFVLLTCSALSPGLQQQVMRKAIAGAATHRIPADAAAYCQAHVRQEEVKTRAKARTPKNPALRDRIEQLFKADQAVRRKDQFDIDRMSRNDLEQSAALEAIFAKYGVPTYRMVGPQAASDFIVMVQHQTPEFRMQVLPGLKANVETGEADPGSYAMVVDRSLTDEGKKQIYGENLTCDKEHPVLQVGPIEDEKNVDQRRAAIGLMRLGLYADLVRKTSPDVCRAGSSAR
jgi:hypothetical protein